MNETAPAGLVLATCTSLAGNEKLSTQAWITKKTSVGKFKEEWNSCAYVCHTCFCTTRTVIFQIWCTANFTKWSHKQYAIVYSFWFLESNALGT